MLILDPGTGQIFASENVLLDPASGRNLAVRVPYSESLTVVTDRGRSARPGPPSK